MGLLDSVKKVFGGKPEPQAPAPSSGGGNRNRNRGGSGSGNRNRASGGTGTGSSGGSGQRSVSRSRAEDGTEGSSGGQRSGNRNRNRNRNRSRSGGAARSGQAAGGQRTQGGQDSAEGQTPRQGSGQGTSSSRNRNRNRNRGRGGSGTGAGRRPGTGEGGADQQGEGGTSTRQGGQGRQRSGSQSQQRSRSRRGGRPRERSRRGSASSGSHRRVLDANERPKDPVKKQILINASDPNEIRVAIREQTKVVEVYVERKGKRSLAGNIFKGRVQNVLPGMEAAFVDIGLERNGFLYVDEVTPAAADSDQKMKVTMATGSDPVEDDGADTGAGDAEPAAAAEVNGDSTTVQVDAPASDATDTGSDAEDASDSEAVDVSATIEEEERQASGAEPKSSGRRRARGKSQATKKKIQELLRPGQEILVQVVKDPMGTKGSRLTTQYSLAGRYLVYVPDGEGLGVSRRLEDAERERLRNIVKPFELPAGGGLIVRTAAEGAAEEDIARDLQLLLKLHEQLMEKSVDQRAPKLLYNEADLSLRIIRDLFNDEVEGVIVDDERQYQRIVNYLKRTSPSLIERVTLWDGQRPLFETHGVEQAIKSTLNKRVNLPGGGYLIIDYAEAFTVIDVNTGRNVGKSSLEDTITKTNMEAAEEIVRQLRLRDIGGIIVVDFIDMNLMKNRDSVLEHYRKELSKDRTKTYLVEISPLGLVEMTRQNVSDGVREILTSTCVSCEGRGVQVSAETNAIEVEQALVELASGLGDDVEAVAVEASPAVQAVLVGNLQKQRDLTKRAGKTIRVFADPELDPNTFALRAQGTTAEIEAMLDPLHRGMQITAKIESVDPANERDGIAIVNGVTVIVIGAGGDVGEERNILIEAASTDRAFATLIAPPRRRRRRGGRGRRTGRAQGDGTESGTDLVDAIADDEMEDAFDGEDDGDDGEDDGDEIPTLDAGDDGRVADDLEDDHASEIPERFVMIDDEDGSDDEDEDEDEDDDEDDDDEEDVDDADDEPMSSYGADDDSDDSEPASEDSSAAPRSSVADLPEIEERVDSLLVERGVRVAAATPSGGNASTAPRERATVGGEAGSSANRRRRRGSRGGRNRRRPAGATGAGGEAGGSDSTGSSPEPGGSGSDSSGSAE